MCCYCSVKFASDFAEKYRMPAIQLTEDAKRVLLSYSWPGNVRQLKNITEQISIIETNREINAPYLAILSACSEYAAYCLPTTHKFFRPRMKK